MFSGRKPPLMCTEWIENTVDAVTKWPSKEITTRWSQHLIPILLISSLDPNPNPNPNPKKNWNSKKKGHEQNQINLQMLPLSILVVNITHGGTIWVGEIFAQLIWGLSALRRRRTHFFKSEDPFYYELTSI